MLQYIYNIIITNVIIHAVNIVCTSMCSTTNHFIFFFVQRDYYQILFLLKFLKISSSSRVTEEFHFLKVLVLSHFYESEYILYQN